MELIEAFGPKLVVLLTLAAAAWFALTLAPVIWPAVRAFRKKTALPRPWLFVSTVAALTYGALFLALFVLLIPAEAYAVYIAPSLESMGQPYGKSLVRATRFVANYWWVLLPPAQLAVTVLLTRRLASKWAGICSALAA
ncbi:hypothetical protein [Lysobacter sp. M15]|uniref:hypothetical protein n=1 Tax=Lysobacter sp. M15 TaxID=2916837 RepID=UPI001F573B27|nr:hypothetical protein [Lysobacter sp. M15]